MHARTMLTISAALPLLLSSPALAQDVTFTPQPSFLGLYDMSPDGRWMIGDTLNLNPGRLDVLTGQVSILVGGTSVSAISDDGTIAVGNTVFPGTGEETAGIWRVGQGWQALGGLNGEACGSLSSGYDLSGDGSVVVGLGWASCSGRGFVWTEATGMQGLESLGNGGNRASVVSSDGSVIAGFAQGSFSRTPAVWSSDLTGELLDPPNGDALGEIHGISDDGTVLLGTWNGDACRWDDGVRTVLGQGQLIPGWQGIPTDISDDGTIVGFDFLQGNRRAWILPAGTTELVLLSDWIVANGGVLPDGTVTTVASSISADGSVICGFGIPGNAWTVHIDNGPACPTDLDDTGDTGFSDVLAVLANWGTDGDGAAIAAPEDVVDFSDVISLLSAFGPCP